MMDERNIMSTIDVAIVNYNTRDLLHSCLVSLIAELPGRIIVIDNASSDGSAAMVQAEFPTVTLIANAHNPGYGTAVNQAFAGSAATYVLLLNSDVIVQPGALAILQRHLDRHPLAGVVGPRLVNLDGSLQPSCFHFQTPLYILLEQISLGRLLRFIPFLRDRYLPAWCYDRPRVVPWMLGAAMAIRTTAFDTVGGFDEAFFMYSEEVDFCYRLRAAGWETHFTPAATIVHIGGASTVQRRVDMAVHAFKSTLAFYRRHYSRWQLAQTKLIFTVATLAKMMRDLVILRWAHEDQRRAGLTENIRIWLHILSELRQGAW
jgi:GT2 family glycosyltransferase